MTYDMIFACIYFFKIRSRSEAIDLSVLLDKGERPQAGAK